MVMFHRFWYVYQRVYPIKIPLNHYKIPVNHYKIPLKYLRVTGCLSQHAIGFLGLKKLIVEIIIPEKQKSKTAITYYIYMACMLFVYFMYIHIKIYGIPLTISLYIQYIQSHFVVNINTCHIPSSPSPGWCWYIYIYTYTSK
jgi:hypothetical protein